MEPMFVTPEVSKLSGWLNADVNCRELKGGHTVRGKVRPAGGGRRQATAGHAACRGGSATDWEQGTGRSARRTCAPCS